MKARDLGDGSCINELTLAEIVENVTIIICPASIDSFYDPERERIVIRSKEPYAHCRAALRTCKDALRLKTLNTAHLHLLPALLNHITDYAAQRLHRQRIASFSCIKTVFAPFVSHFRCDRFELQSTVGRQQDFSVLGTAMNELDYHSN